MDLLKSLQALFGIDSAARMDRAAPKDEFRQHQDHDLYKKNIRLKEQLDEARERILQLENQLGSMEEESTEVEKKLESKREEIGQMTAGVAAQIREMSDALEVKLNQLEVKTVEQFSRMAGERQEQAEGIEQISEQLGEIRGSLSQLDEIRASMQQMAEIRSMLEKLEDQRISIVAINEAADELKGSIAEKIHAENVKCYRNMKSLVTDLEVKMEQMELGDESLKKIRKSFKGMKFFAFFAFADFILLIVYILFWMGVF